MIITLKLPVECGPIISDNTKHHCRNKQSMITLVKLLIYTYIHILHYAPSLIRAFQKYIEVHCSSLKFVQFVAHLSCYIKIFDV